ncbi:MAG: type II toxin-antitoxin system PrlF family antitoxin [Luteolibacter sp.]|jgi:antitoxin PrlF
MNQSTLTAKNQTTIPKAVIEALKIRPSEKLIYEIESDGKVLLSTKTGTFASVAASLPRKRGKTAAKSPEQIDDAARSMAARRFPRKRS